MLVLAKRYANSNFPALYYIVICGLSDSSIFFSILYYKWHHFLKKKSIEHKMCFDFIYVV